MAEEQRTVVPALVREQPFLVRTSGEEHVRKEILDGPRSNLAVFDEFVNVDGWNVLDSGKSDAQNCHFNEHPDEHYNILDDGQPPRIEFLPELVRHARVRRWCTTNAIDDVQNGIASVPRGMH